jgi:hypothetical protein
LRGKEFLGLLPVGPLRVMKTSSEVTVTGTSGFNNTRKRRGAYVNLCFPYVGSMRVKMNTLDFALRKRNLSPVRLDLEDSSIRSFVLFVDVSLSSIGDYNLI